MSICVALYDDLLTFRSAFILVGENALPHIISPRDYTLCPFRFGAEVCFDNGHSVSFIFSQRACYAENRLF